MRYIEKLEKECFTKKRYGTKEFAHKVIGRIKEEKGLQLYSYRCSNCGTFHLTKLKDHNNRYQYLKVI